MWLSSPPRAWRHCDSVNSGVALVGKLNCSNFKLDVHNDQIRAHCTLASNLRRNFTLREMAPNIRKLFTFILLIFHVSKYLQETLARKICLMFERSCVYKSFELMIYLCCSLWRKIWKRTCFWGKWWIPCFFTIIPGFTWKTHCKGRFIVNQHGGIFSRKRCIHPHLGRCLNVVT